MTSIGARVVLSASSVARKVGQALDSMGASMEVANFTERLVPSTRFVAVDGIAPVVSNAAAFVAPSASVIGDVSMGKNSSIWYGATVRGDVHTVTIGENTSIGDRAVVHVAKIQGDFPTHIGNNVTVGPGAIVHAAMLGDSVLIGASAQVLDGAHIESISIVAPGAIVTPGTKVATGELWAGSPARKVRELTTEEIASISDTANHTAELASLHAVECAKDYKELAFDEEEFFDNKHRDPDYFQRGREDLTDVLGQGAPGRIFDSTLTSPEEGLKIRQARKQK